MIITSTKKIENIKDLGLKITLPTECAKKYTKALNEIDDKLEYKKLSAQSQIAITTMVMGGNSLNREGIFEDRKNATYDLIKNDKRLNISEPNIKLKGDLRGRKAKMAARSFMGLGSIRQIPLYHSGFWITLDVISPVDKAVLDAKLADRELELGMDTSGLIYSNDVVIYTSILLDFITDYILDTSLEIPEDTDIKDHISIFDIDALALGLISAFHTDGFDIAMTCKNTIEVVEDNKDKDGKVLPNDVLCNYTISGKVDPKEMLFIDKDRLSDFQLDIMSKRSPNSVTIDDVEKYRDEFNNSNNEKVLEYDKNGKVLKMYLDFCNLNRYISAGDKFIREVTEVVDRILMGDENPDVRKDKVDSIVKDVVLNKYIHFINTIDLDGLVATDVDGIYDILNIFTEDNEFVTEILKDIHAYINDQLISMVGTPVYTCPKCRKDNSENAAVKPFNNLVPLDVLTVFTNLRTIRHMTEIV